MSEKLTEFKFSWYMSIYATSVEEAILELRKFVTISPKAPFYIIENTRSGVARMVNLECALNSILEAK